MNKFSVSGMSCATCSARVEKAVSDLPGVDSCAVSFLTNSMSVEGTADAKSIVKAVEKAGYGAKLITSEEEESKDILSNSEVSTLKKRLIASVVVLLVLMYFSMGHMMLGLPVPRVLESHIALGWLQAVLALIVLIINSRFFTSGIKSLVHLAPNMDSLVALGSGTAYVYSLVELIAMGQDAYMNLYFESAAMIPTLITIGKLLEAMAKGKTTSALKDLIEMSPKQASVIRLGKEQRIDIEEVRVDDIFLVRPGEQVPVDGVVMEGESAVDESALTGESVPVDKSKNNEVFAGSINQSGILKCQASRIGKDTSLSQIVQLVKDAATTKAPLARIADKVSAVFVPVVIAIAIITFIAWLIAGETSNFAITRAITVLVISCPCALGLATPVAIMVGNGVGARNGIMYKTAEALETMGRVDVVALDKTGTITKGMPKVEDIKASGKMAMADQLELLKVAYSLEKRSEHPLSRAVVSYCEESLAGELVGTKDVLKPYDVEGFEALPGMGLRGKADGVEICGGNLNFVLKEIFGEEAITGDMIEKLQKGTEKLEQEGKSCLFFAKGERLLGTIVVSDEIRKDSREAIKQIEDMGVEIIMLTGDKFGTAKRIGDQVGIRHILAEMMPGDKERLVRNLQERARRKLAMTGDGINDAPALTRADVGVAIGAGTDIAVNAAEVVLVNNKPSDIAKAMRLSRATIKNIHENLFWAFIYNIICIPLAMGLYGIEMRPIYGAIAMSLSSICVCLNALRLGRIDLNKGEKDKKKKYAKKAKPIGPVIEELQQNIKHDIKRKEVTKMKKKISIEGMMCQHCEANVKGALEALKGVDSADVSHERGNAIVDLSEDVLDEDLKNAVEAKDYKVLSIGAE